MSIYTNLGGGGGAGGNPFDQSLNQADDAVFSSVTIDTIKNSADTDIVQWDIDNNITIYNVDGVTPLLQTNMSANPILAGITYPNADGTAGQVLTTDGAGVVTFQDLFDQSLNTSDRPEFNQGIANISGAIQIDASGAVSLNGLSSWGTEGQVVTSHGTGSPITWENAPNPFDQDLNTSDSPSFSGLDVGAISFPAADGSAGHVMTTDGAGILDLGPVSDIADGTYVLGIGVTSDGTITFVNGRITAIQECT